MGSNNLGDTQQPKGPATEGLSDLECPPTQCQGSTPRRQAVFRLNVHVVMMLRHLREPQTTETMEVGEGSGRHHQWGRTVLRRTLISKSLILATAPKCTWEVCTVDPRSDHHNESRLQPASL